MHPENDAILEKGYLSQIEPIKEASFLWDGIAHFTRLLRPSFLTIASSSHRNTKLRRTAYLDGIRGVAALLVYVLHHELWAHAFYDGDVKLENSFGHKGKYYLGAFWGLRTFFTGGHYAVSTFFVLSGYVLSAKPLALIQAGEFLQLNDTVASALFRRWLRLFLPIIITTWMILTFYHVTGITGTFKPEKTYFGELWKWYAEGKNFTFIFTTGGEPWFTYNPHTWSIPVEMKGSIVIYTSVMAFSRLSQRGRLWAEVLLAVYFMYVADGAHFSMFVAGMFICDLETLHLNNKLPSWFTEIGGRHQNAMFHGIFALSVFLGGVPAQSSDMQQFREQPGWRWLSTLKPQAVFDFKWFYLFWAATLLVVCVPRLPWLKRFFESRFAQYLARISYSFYLVHGPILWLLGDRLYAAVGYSGEQHALSMPKWVNCFPIPKIGPFGMEISFLLPHLILLPITFWAAELCTTLVDDPSIKFTQWLYKQFRGSQDSGTSSARKPESR